MHLIREFTPDAYEFALSSWSWIGIGDKTPRFASCFGDMFLESIDGWWFLDTVEGTLERRWNTLDAMFSELEEPDGRAEYLLEETLSTALAQGLRLGDDEVFAFLPPPAVTGTMSVDSLAPLRFAIAANLAGRIHGELNGVQPDAGASALFAAQNAAVHAAASFDTPNPPTDRWQPAAQHVSTGAYPAYRPEPGYAAAHAAAHHAAPAADGYAQTGYGSAGYAAGHDYVDSSHLDSGQFSQYIADQYNTGQVAAVDRAPAPLPQQPQQGGRWSFA
ncbi:DUF1851 domain-containing protein [Promicromonospora thailandica]|uniref:Uncharacterized protein n=1 Tax=Promicromonospora thailandica TaxID=765201 RepID=A0A9X2JVQ5_9MICO|nr:DUF1851 domain-containing protein [Promicromonospora thailandica]MCP2265321.1 hypothetical protein [Promicromonospora thailandica]BFF16851.1 hypothetical protein GCM10025730_03720 [Promicromonospora thailandica]